MWYMLMHRVREGGVATSKGRGVATIVPRYIKHAYIGICSV